jgi:hypothetical protein
MSVGEEALNDSTYLTRSESCFAEQDTAVLAFERDSWINTRETLMYEAYSRGRRGDEEQIARDILMLDEILRFNYYNKKKMRDKKVKMVGKLSNRNSVVR